MMGFFTQYKYIALPLLVWFCIQLFKFIYDLIKTRKFNFKRILGAGGMPSSHSAVVTCLSTLIAKSQGIDSPVFGVAVIFSCIVMYDAAGLSGVQVTERLQEVLGHTPMQVIVGAIIGIIVGLIFG